MIALGIFLACLGLAGLAFATTIIWQPMNTAQLSMRWLGRKKQEHLEGLSFKYLFSTLQKPQIDMTARVLLTSGGIFIVGGNEVLDEKFFKKITPKAYETENGKSIVYASWATHIQPLEGHLAKMINKTVSVGAIMTIAKIDLFLSDKVSSMKTTDVVSQKQMLSDAVSGIFNGKATCSFEEDYGINIGEPKLYDIGFSPKSQEAIENVFVASKMKEALAELDGAVNKEEALNGLLVATGKASKNIYSVENMKEAAFGIGTGLAKLAEAFIKKVTT